MISDKISDMIATSLKAGETLKVSTFRLLSSAFNYEKIALQHDLTEQDELNVIRREAKKRKEAIEAYEKAGALDRANKEKEELAILSEFLPAELTDDQLTKLVEEAITKLGVTSLADMGKVIGSVKEATHGAADGAKVAFLVKARLS